MEGERGGRRRRGVDCQQLITGCKGRTHRAEQAPPWTQEPGAARRRRDLWAPGPPEFHMWKRAGRGADWKCRVSGPSQAQLRPAGFHAFVSQACGGAPDGGLMQCQGSSFLAPRGPVQPHPRVTALCGWPLLLSGPPPPGQDEQPRPDPPSVSISNPGSRLSAQFLYL